MIANVCELIASDLEDARGDSRSQQIAHRLHRSRLPLALPALIERLHPRVPPLAFALWRAGDSRPARGPSHDHDADLGAVSIPAAFGSGRGIFGAAAACDDGADRRAEKNPWAQRLQYGRRQRRRRRLDPPGLGAHPGACCSCSGFCRSRFFCRIGFCSKRRCRKPGRCRWPGRILRSTIFTFAFFEYGDTQLAIYNTFKFGIVTATIGTLLATLIAYITNRNLFRGARYLTFFALAPLVIPGIVLAVGLVYRLHAAAAGALRHDMDSVRGLFNQRDADRIFSGRIDLQEHSPRA